jgi:eukaryotic-like serine/threonine-protein kinase
VKGLLNRGTPIQLRQHALDCVVDEFIGAGGQGEVYRLRVDGGATSDDLALKWYFPEWATRQQWDDLSALIEVGPPSARFLWPIDLAMCSGRPGFGYVMPLRPARFHSCVEIMCGRLEISFSSLLRVCLRVADGFLSLHARGLCYRDISFGNIFIDPTSGDVLIADNDNVAVDGRGAEGVHGTERFMAPEIVRGEALPSTATDLYSLSVLLFYLLMVSHPLEGLRMARADVFGREEALELYGRHPVFVFDPHDTSNGPDPERHWHAAIYWSLYPRMIRELFVRAFTDGLSDPMGGRVREGEWRDCLARLLDLLVPCRCGASTFLEPDGRVAAPCWSCGSPTPTREPLPRLVLDPELDRHVVVLNLGRRLFAHHLRTRRYDYREVAAEVVRHPTKGDVTGLRNLSAEAWTARANGGGDVIVPPGRSITIAPGTTIAFGSSETGVIEL